MDLQKIKALLEKYYSGESSLEEEEILRTYFTQADVIPELQPDKDIFMFNLEQKSEQDNMPDMSEQIWRAIEEDNLPKTISMKQKVVYWSLRVAAGIVVLLASFFLLKNQVQEENQSNKITDTYNNPEEAYKQAKQTLLYVSAMLNNGTEHLEPIQKINEGKEKLNPLASFNDGIKELNQIKKYQIANKYIKQ